MMTLTSEEQRVFDVLVFYAKRSRDITYSELLSKANVKMDAQINRIEFGRLLGRICEFSHERNLPLLSCVTHAKDYSHGGFCTIAEDLYSIKLRGSQERLEFICNEINKVYENAREGNYDKYVKTKFSLR